MTIIISALATALAAFTVWLTVRIINRRERWARWTAVALFVVAIGYPLSIGPVYWLMWRADPPEWTGSVFDWFYSPIQWSSEFGPEWMDSTVSSYMAWGISDPELPWFSKFE